MFLARATRRTFHHSAMVVLLIVDIGSLSAVSATHRLMQGLAVLN